VACTLELAAVTSTCLCNPLQRRPPAVVLFAAVSSLVVCDVTLFGRPPTCADLCCSVRPPKLCRRITCCYACRVSSHALDTAAAIVVQLFHTTCSKAKFSAVVVPNSSRQRNAASSECEVVIFF